MAVFGIIGVKTSASTNSDLANIKINLIQYKMLHRVNVL